MLGKVVRREIQGATEDSCGKSGGIDSGYFERFSCNLRLYLAIIT